MARERPTVLRDVQSGREYPVPAGGLRIGRTSQNDVVLRDDKVSRNHATLWLQEGQLYVRDENSTNGTWVNGERISAPRVLHEGDQVRVGDAAFQVAGGAAAGIPDEMAPAPARTSFPVVPTAIAGGVIVVVMVGLMVRGLGGATVTPTETPTVAPSETVAPTETPTVTPTSTATPRPTQAPTRASTPAPQAEAPQLIAPAQGEEYGSPITFQWSGSLSGGQTFQVTISHVDSGHTIQSGLLTSQEWSRGLPDDRVGEWRWSVSVVDAGNVVAASDEWMFWFNPFPGSGGGGGGDGDGSSSGPPSSPTNTPTPSFRP